MTSANLWRIQAPKTNSAQAYERLRRAIIEGEFKTGERLTEAAVAELLGVSRTPVREAFARLTKDGLVRNTKGAGIEVVDPRQEFVDIYYIREMIEGCAARLAAMRASAEQVARIVELARASRDTDPADVEARATLNTEFHLTISAAANAPRLDRLISDYRELFASPHILKAYSPSETRKAVDDHAQIADAIAQRDPDGAEKAMRDHLRSAYAMLLKASDEAEEGPGRRRGKRKP